MIAGGAVSDTARDGAPIEPAEGMAPLSALIGTWRTTGTVRAIDDDPATTLAATDTYRWLPGGHFIAHEAHARFGGAASWSLELIGAGDDDGYASTSYDDQGATETFALSLDGRAWRIRGDSTRFDGAFEDGGDALAGLWERKDAGGTWRPWIELRLERAPD